MFKSHKEIMRNDWIRAFEPNPKTICERDNPEYPHSILLFKFKGNLKNIYI